MGHVQIWHYFSLFTYLNDFWNLFLDKIYLKNE